MSTDYSQKLIQIRKAEKLTQAQFAEIVSIPLGTIQKYEPGHQVAGALLAERVINVDRFKKYALWLMIGETALGAGQISPTLSPDGYERSAGNQESTEDVQKSHH